MSFESPTGRILENVRDFCKTTPPLAPLLLAGSAENGRLDLDLDSAEVVNGLAAMFSSLDLRPSGLALGFHIHRVGALNRTEAMPEIPELIRAFSIEAVTITNEPFHPTHGAPGVAAKLSVKGPIPLSTAMSRVEARTSGAATDVPLNNVADIERVVRSFHNVGHAPPSGVLHLGLINSVAMRDTPLPDVAVAALHRVFIRSIVFTNLDHFCW